jgi:ethanolamine transporter EutH
MLILQGILIGTISMVLVGNFPMLKKPFFTKVLVFAERPVSSFCKICTFSQFRSSFVKLIQLLKHQKQHSKPLLKIAEKPDNFFAMALFFGPIL